jgi:DNA-binding response OmpR family regulator
MMKPSIVFVDHKIPQLEATGVCKSLLADNNAQAIPVFVVADTASVNGELKTFSNFKGVVQRPLQAQDITSKIQLILEGKAGQAGAQSPKAATASREGPIRVLSVDDSSVVRKLVTMILTAEGFKVTTASDGVDGINKAKELLPDVILLDFVMPKMNGFQVCRILQKDEKLRQIPVILVTSKGDKVGDKFVDQLGVTGYITKPFQPEELVSKIHQTLESREVQESGVAAPVAPQPQPTTAPAAAPIAQQPAAAPSVAPAAAPAVTPDALEAKVAELVKAEVEKVMKTLDKRIEKMVIEKMNEYIRRAKKK